MWWRSARRHALFDDMLPQCPYIRITPLLCLPSIVIIGTSFLPSPCEGEGPGVRVGEGGQGQSAVLGSHPVPALTQAT